MEFRLRDGETQVDLQQQFRRNDGVYPQLAHYLSSPALSGVDGLEHFANELSDVSSVLSRHVDEIFLEFDLPFGREPSFPSIFLSLPDDPATAREVAARAINLLSGQASSNLQTAVDHCIGTCKNGEFVSGLGLMLGRTGDFVRINVKRLLPSTVECYLAGIGYSGNCRAAAEQFTASLTNADRVTLALDLKPQSDTVQVLPRIGMECFFDEQPDADPLWEQTLSELCEDNLCSTAKLHALMALPGETLPISTETPWPLDLIAQSTAQPEDHFSAFVRKLYHLKLSGEPGGQWEAKAYLGASHEWIAPAATRSWKAPSGPPRKTTLRDEQTPHGISDAIEAGTHRLLRCQPQSGLWRDFKTPSLSDEWVSAFIAFHLLDTDFPSVRDAAEECAAALLRTQRSDGGWGYWIHQAPDADSTAWVLHLLKRLHLEHSEAFKNGMNFLRRHTSENGGVRTYADHVQLSTRMGMAVDESFGGWEQTHICVTAAAAPLLPDTSLVFLRRLQRNGHWSGYWWHGDAYPTAMAVSALAGRSEYADIVSAAQRWAAASILEIGNSKERNAFDLAFCLKALCAADLHHHSQQIHFAIELLLHLQIEDGWLPAARMRIPLPSTIVCNGNERVHLDYRGNFTTAAVVSALAIAQRALQQQGNSL
ncbi:prenyltransferase/squalene oxidase repeat-containing protein [Terriglobus sp. RCC_193]|uniref:prenyltransferase/squalene oxidase repeat-containing protein n=1 Tax=Terriglobus sp. RCC_193 TaxID=3239218 RepID=UPI003524D3E3